VTREARAPGKGIVVLERQRRVIGVAASVAVVAAAAFGARLLLGMRIPVDGDEATLGVSALRITQGHLITMDVNQHYLGALEAYVAAPFVALFGTTALALRLALATVGAGYTLAMYALGRALFRTHRSALVLSGLSAVVPLFAVWYGDKARGGYGEMLLFQALCLALVVRIGWGAGRPRTRDWALLGLVSGVALWNDLLIALPLAVAVLALLVRARALGPRSVVRGGAVAAAAAVVGFTPWLVHNLRHHFDSLGGLPNRSVAPQQAWYDVLTQALPIFTGAHVSCFDQVAPARLIDITLLSLSAAVGWVLLRRSRRPDAAPLGAMTAVLVAAPLSLLSVTVGQFNAVSCEPRYLLPLAVPLTVAVATVLVGLGTIGRSAAVAVLAGWLAVSGVAATRVGQGPGGYTTLGASLPRDMDDVVAHLSALHVSAIWADYWLARPLLYASGGRLVIGEYYGYPGFPENQEAAAGAAHPSWLFAAGDPEIGFFETGVEILGITYKVTRFDGMVLYGPLSAPLEPAALGLATG